jgi:hypothetical protein
MGSAKKTLLDVPDPIGRIRVPSLGRRVATEPRIILAGECCQAGRKHVSDCLGGRGRIVHGLDKRIEFVSKDALVTTGTPFSLPLETIVAASSLMGHRLEDRTCIRDRQDLVLLESLQDSSTVPLRGTSQQSLFVVAPLDIMVSGPPGQTQFHIIELNGTGIGGLTNMSSAGVSAVLNSLKQITQSHWEREAVYLVAISGKECIESPRLNRMVHEKLLFAEALKAGFGERGSQASILALPDLLRGEQAYHPGEPAIVLGYIKDFLDALMLDDDGRLHLAGRPVSGAVNDRFCLNVISQFGGQVDLKQFQTVNRCFLAGGDKGVGYALLNEYLAEHPHVRFPKRMEYAHAQNRENLIDHVVRWKELGRKTVIKPHGTGIGHGIEFFLDPLEPVDPVIERIDHSIRTTEEYYHTAGGAFPYTLCEFIDSRTISQMNHPMHGHKYELRVVVYREALALKAFPSIVKIAPERFDAINPDHGNLINNITASAVREKNAGMEHMLPLTNLETIRLLNLSVDDIQAACKVATGYVRYILDQVEDQPQRFGLPGSSQQTVSGDPPHLHLRSA